MADMRKIIIDGVEYPCFQTMGAMLYYKEETGEEVTAMKPDEISKLILFFYCTIKAACDRKKVEFPYSAREFSVMIDADTLTGWQTSMDGEPAEENGEKKSPRQSRNS